MISAWRPHSSGRRGSISRHNGIPATVEIDGDIEDLSEALRTCVYRVVQESLTNCARHAKAKNVRITVHGGKERHRHCDSG